MSINHRIATAITWWCSIRVLWPGVQAAVDINETWCEWDYRIKFKSGAEFKGPDHNDVFERARLYAQGIKNLIGEYP